MTNFIDARLEERRLAKIEDDARKAEIGGMLKVLSSHIEQYCNRRGANIISAELDGLTKVVVFIDEHEFMVIKAKGVDEMDVFIKNGKSFYRQSISDLADIVIDNPPRLPG